MQIPPEQSKNGLFYQSGSLKIARAISFLPQIYLDTSC